MKLTNRISLSLLMTLPFAVLFLSCQQSPVAPIRIVGSTTIEPFMKNAAAEYAKVKKTEFMISGTGSRNGIDSLIAGVGDIAMSSMEITPEEVRLANERKISLKTYLLGYDIILPVVHPSNPVTDISFADLKRIYTGKITSWAAVGGADTIIDIVDRSDASGTYSVWHAEVVPAQVADTRYTILPSNSAVLAYIAEHRNAIGYISNVFINPDVKPLKLDGIDIAKSSAMLPEYHLKRPLYLFVNEDRFSSDARMFLMFLLIDERGRSLLHKQGFFSSFSHVPLFNSIDKVNAP